MFLKNNVLRNEHSKSKVFVEQINLLRGAFAKREKRHYTAEQEFGENLVFRTTVKKCFLYARASLSDVELGYYLDWFYNQLNTRVPNFLSIPIGFDYLNGIAASPSVPLTKELSWIGLRLLKEKEALKSFRERADKINTAAVSGAFSLALSILSKIVQTHGESMWSVQLRLGLEQCFGGLESQKKYYEEVRSIHKRGILAYVAHNTSVRNEDRTSLGRYYEGLATRIGNKYDANLQAYLRYRLFGEWPLSDLGIADILQIEQSHSIIDIYETFICLGQEICRRSDLKHLVQIFLPILNNLKDLNDFRVHKLSLFFGQTYGLSNLSKRNLAPLEALLRADIVNVVRSSKQSDTAVIDPWLLIYRSLGLAHGKAYRLSHFSIFLPFVTPLTRILGRSKTCSQDAAELEKFCINLSGLSCPAAILDFLRELKPTLSDQFFRFPLVGLNSPYMGPEDIGMNSKLDESLKVLFSNEWDEEHIKFWRAQTDAQSKPKVHQEMIAFAKAIYFLRTENYTEVVAEVSPYVHSNFSEILRNFSVSLLIRGYMELGERTKTILLLGDEGALNPACSAFLPIQEALEHLDYRDYQAVDQPLLALIALALLWQETDNDKTASMLRFATGQFLRSVDKVKPSALIDKGFTYPRHQIVYFLRRICVPHVIDVSRIFKGSREVLEERQAICGTLNTLDPHNTEEYQAEIFSISHRLKVLDGLRIVDKNRVHVDTDAINRWANRTILEDFSRYKDLAKVGIGVSSDLDEIYQEIINASKSKKAIFFTPESEADNILVDIIKRVREEFLNNSNYGLDYFLSKRVRHQSFIGLLRGPLEFSHLITTRNTEHGEYKDNIWLDKFTSLDKGALDKMSALFKVFAERFDTLMLELKDNLFHVRSKEHPKGIFEIDISNAILVILRAIANNTDTLEDFLLNVYGVFWISLEVGLGKARALIENHVKMRIAEEIDILQGGIRQYAEGNSNFAELSLCISLASGEVQAALTEAALWFSPPDGKQATHTFSVIEALDVAVESALKLHRAFDPKITRSLDGEAKLSAPDLVFITDVVFIAFDNIKRHSNLVNPLVDVSIKVNSAGDFLTLEITNEINLKGPLAVHEQNLDKIRTLANANTQILQTKREGGSGFLKLAASVKHYPVSTLEFEYVDERKFRLYVGVPTINVQLALAEAA